MADHFNLYELKQFAATIAECMDFPLPESYAPSIGWAAKLLKERMGGAADRVVLYHADAVGHYIWQKYNNRFAPVYRHTSMSIPFVSTVESVTPVAHASMYTGLDPAGHGIETYVRPQLTCDTLFDRCEIRSLNDARGIGYVAAPAHELSQTEGLHFRNCDFTCEEGVEQGSIYLARPWRDYGLSRFENCTYAGHIAPCGFDKWNDTDRDKTARFYETPAVPGRVAWANRHNT